MATRHRTRSVSSSTPAGRARGRARPTTPVPPGFMRVRRGNRYVVIKRRPNKGGWNPFSAIVDVVNDFGDFIGDVPVVGDGLKGAYELTFSAPFNVANAIASGKRVDQVALDTLERQLDSVKAVAPYAQTIVSFVPGVGTGVSAAIGASVALAEGKTIDQAVLEGIKSALPGGPAARAAFEIAEGIASGQPLDQIAIDAAPISTAAKRALRPALQISKDLARGKNVSEALIQEGIKQLPPAGQAIVRAARGGPNEVAELLVKEGLKQLPPDARTAFNTGVSVGNAVNLQKLVKASTINKLESVLNTAKKQLHGWKKSGIGEMMDLIDDVANNANDAAKSVGARLTTRLVQNTKQAGLALVYPVGVPSVAMVAAAGAINSAARSGIPDRRAAAKKLIVNTALASQMGNIAARRALQTLAIVAKSRPGRVGVSFGRAISPARVGWLRRQKSSVREKWRKSRAHLPRVMAEYNRLFPRLRPPTLKPRTPSAKPKPGGAIEAAEKRGEMRATLRAIKAMREQGRTGIMMGTRQIDHGKYVEVP